MKDFKNKNLYKLEQGTFETFVDEMLETNSQYNQDGRLRSGLNEEEEEETDYFGSIDGWDDDSGGMSDFDFDFSSGLDNFSSDNTDILMNPRGYTVEEMGTMKMLLTAPIYAIQQAGGALVNTNQLNPTTRKRIAKDWRIWGLVLGSFSLLGLFPFITSFIYLPIGILMLVSSGLADYYYGTQGGHSIIQELMKGDESDFEEDEEETEELDDGLDDGLGGYGSSGGDDFGAFGDFSGYGDMEEEDDTFNDRYMGFDDEEEEVDFEIDPESAGANATKYFPESPIDTSTTDTFRKGLLDVYQSGQYSKGEMLQKRDEIVRYYAKYMPNNDEGFSKWYNIVENSPEYDNIAYTIYKALVSIDGKFDMRTAVPKGEKLTVMEMKRTPLIYKITVKLPSYFKINSVTTRSNIFNDMLKASDDDESVGTILTTYGGDLVIKFLRLDYRKLVSMGDLLRLSDDESEVSFAEKFVTDKGIPMIAGMRDNEYPYMVDIVGNPAASIVGGSGSGKSWLTFQFMDSMLISNNPEHLNFLILDAKDAAIWKQFALAPHVLGYHSDYNTFYSILLEVKAEHERRMAELSRLGIESWKDYTSRAKREGDDEKLAEMPLLFVIVDEITYTMSSLQTENDSLYKELKSILTQLSSVIRASGIRMMLIGQRAIDTSIPKGFMANSPLKLAMKMNVQSDFTTMLGKGYDREVSRIPSGPGEGIMQSEGQVKPSYVKTVIPGGKDDGDILMQVRVMALDWVRRTQGTRYDYTTLFNDMSSTINTGFNRDMYYNQALGAIEEGRITDPVRVDEEYLMTINSPNANLIGNAMENVERRLGQQESEQHMEFNVEEELEYENNDYDYEEDVETTETLDDFDWDSLLDEPEEMEFEEESEVEEVSDEFNFGIDFDEEELPEEEMEFEQEDTEEEPTYEFNIEDYEQESTEEVGFEFGEELPEEIEIEDYPEEVYEEQEEPEIEIELGDYTEEDTEDDFNGLSLEDILADEPEEVEEEPQVQEVEIADETDISSMLDMAMKTQESIEETEEPVNEAEAELERERQEIAELKRKQQEMLDKLQQQQEEQEILARERQEEVKRKAEEERKRKALEEKKQKELEEQNRLAKEQEEIRKQREELEQQMQQIEQMKKELAEQQKRAEQANTKVTPEPEVKEQEEEVTELKKTEVEVRGREEVKENTKPSTTQVKQEPTPKQTQATMVKEKPKVVSKPKPKPRQPEIKQPKPTVSSPVRTEQVNTVGYQEMENMSVGQYIAQYGEVANGQKRVQSNVIQSKFNRRKVSLAITIGEVYEEEGYLYYIG